MSQSKIETQTKGNQTGWTFLRRTPIRKAYTEMYINNEEVLIKVFNLKDEFVGELKKARTTATKVAPSAPIYELTGGNHVY